MCIATDCYRQPITRGLCAMHYNRLLRHGDINYKSRHYSFGKTANERFDYYTQDRTDCWEWSGYKSKSGYGVLRVGGKDKRVHRFSYERYIGKISNGLIVCHKCDNKSCANPDHLFLGTQKDNMDDMIRKGRACRGEKHHNAAVNEHTVKIIKDMIVAGLSNISISKQLSVTPRIVSSIKTGKSWAWL